MKERPILFSAPMVRALGTKTQTRRPLSVQPVGIPDVAKLYRDRACTQPVMAATWTERAADGSTCCLCPYGVPGDRLWVRENGWERPERTPKMMREGADTWPPYAYDADESAAAMAEFKEWGWKRRPSIHMPRWASRILLEITGVRVERLQDISEADCIAEGAPGGHGAIPGYQYNATPREHYSAVWTAINGADSWNANPCVWVIEFKRMEEA